jgi:spore germination protein GerM
MEGINTQKEVIIPYQNHELTIIFKDYQQKIFDQPELDKVFDRILSTFKFLDEEKEKISVKLYYHDLSTDSSFNSCTADKFKVIEVSPENKIKETIERLLTEGNMEKHPDFKLLNMNLKNGILTLEFPFIPSFTTGGSCRIMLMTDQITKTAKQFEEVKEVRFKPEVFEP